MTARIRTRISEARAEQIADRRVQARLSTDRAYQNAESPAAQTKREDAIAEAVWADIDREYEIA